MSAALASLLVAAHLVSAVSPLEKCRALDKEFDTKAMPKPCQAAADDATLAIPDRVEALRRLAFAHILNGDEALAAPAFLKMLAFSPSSELPSDAGPRFREIFNDAKKRFATEGALGITFSAPSAPKGSEPVAVQIDVADKLGRVVGARIKATIATPTGAAGVPLEERLVRNELEPGQLRFNGPVPEPKDAPPPEGITVSYDVTLEGWDGQPIPVPTPVHGTYARGVPMAAADDAFPWLWVGAGSAAGVAVLGGVTGGLVYCYTAGPCRTQNAWVRIQIHEGTAP